MQRTFGTAALVMLVVLAGCSGVFGESGEPTATLTPAAVPTDEPTPTPVPQLAPGVTKRGLAEPRALVAAYGSVLQNRSFARTSNTTTVATNGSVLIQRTSRLRAGPGGEGFYFVSAQNGSYGYPTTGAFPVRVEGWSDGERVFVKQTYANGTTTYTRPSGDPEELRHTITQGNIGYFLGPFDSNTTAVTEQFSRNGTTLYRINGTSPPSAPTNTSLRMLVDDRGVVHRYRTVRAISSDEIASRVVTETRLSDIGATDAPERPSWVDTAMNRTTATRQTGTARGGG